MGRLLTSQEAKPLFAFRAISVSKFDWSQKSLAEKSIVIAANSVFFIIFLLIVTRSYELSWPSFGHLLKGILILSLFPLIVVPVLASWRVRYPSKNEHFFFIDSARVYIGYGKRGYAWLRAGAAERIKVESATFRNQRFYLITVIFKRLRFRFLGRPRAIRFGVDGTEDLTALFDWAYSHNIEVNDYRTDSSTSSE
jgi:hypothetical protein